MSSLHLSFGSHSCLHVPYRLESKASTPMLRYLASQHKRSLPSPLRLSYLMHHTSFFGDRSAGFHGYLPPLGVSTQGLHYKREGSPLPVARLSEDDRGTNGLVKKVRLLENAAMTPNGSSNHVRSYAGGALAAEVIDPVHTSFREEAERSWISWQRPPAPGEKLKDQSVMFREQNKQQQQQQQQQGQQNQQNQQTMNFPRDAWVRRLVEFARSSQGEVTFNSKEARRYEQSITSLATEMGLFCRMYEKLLVVSKQPLPHYRPDLDARRPQRKLSIPEDVRKRVDKVLLSIHEWRKMVSPAQALFPPRGGGLPPSLGPGGGSLEEYISQQQAASSDEEWGKEASRRRLDPVVDEGRLARRSERLRVRQEEFQASAEGRRMADIRMRLPAFKERDQLLRAIASSQVLVVSGETGCGKTTQLPQFILESAIAEGNGAKCNIICTQPRRISAMSVAERVAAERGEEIGESVGYQVRLEGKKGRDTQLLFCTTGILLRRLSRDPLLEGVTHVVVDEIHERGMNEDFLLIVLRDVLPKRPDLRVVLMSATLNAELFSGYFGNAPMAHIPGFTHPVQSFFLEDILERTSHVLTPDNQIDDYGPNKEWKRQKQINNVRRGKRNHLTGLATDALADVKYSEFSWETQDSIACWNGEALNFNLITSVLHDIVERGVEGSVLVFMTGLEDISAMLEKLRAHPVLGDPRRVLLLGCHGSMATQEQKLIFNPPPRGVRKIVLATNMAETSITIDDCVHVVDCGKAKETSYDALNNVPCLLPTWISRASARQRRGRAGRVRPGVCYHLYPRAVHDAFLEYSPPELLRTPLHSLCLQIKSLKLGGIADFLSRALQPPEALAVDKAIELLEGMGALDSDENLTALGKHLTNLPLEPRVGKMLILGAVMKCLGPILTVAASQAQRDPWLAPLEKKEIADARKFSFAGGDCSDHLALVRAYDGWAEARQTGQARDYCFDNFLSMQTLSSMSSLRRQFLGTLADMGLVSLDAGPEGANVHSHDRDLVRAVILAGFFPSVASAVPRARSTVFKTREDGQVNIHPACVASQHPKFPHPWLSFSEKVKTSSVFVRDGTGVSDAAMLLFGGSLIPGEEPGYMHMPGGYFEFFMPPESARTVFQLRTELDRLLQLKLENPKKDIFEEDGKEIMGAVMDLLHSSRVEGSFIFGRVPRTRGAGGGASTAGRGRSPQPQRAVAESSGAGGQDAKSLLYNRLKMFSVGRPKFYTEEARMQGGRGGVTLHVARVVVRGRTFEGGPANSKKAAEMLAAQAAWAWLEPQSREEVRAPLDPAALGDHSRGQLPGLAQGQGQAQWQGQGQGQRPVAGPWEARNDVSPRGGGGRQKGRANGVPVPSRERGSPRRGSSPPKYKQWPLPSASAPPLAPLPVPMHAAEQPMRNQGGHGYEASRSSGASPRRGSRGSYGGEDSRWGGGSGRESDASHSAWASGSEQRGAGQSRAGAGGRDYGASVSWNASRRSSSPSKRRSVSPSRRKQRRVHVGQG